MDMIKDDKDVIDVDALMSKEERAEYEKWLTIFKTITPFNVPDGLNKIVDTFNTSRSDGVILLAYIKFFEQRLLEMNKNDSKKKGKDYDGAMFG